MKVLLVGEGASELNGALETLVRRLGLNEADIDTDRVSQQSIHAHHGKGKGYFKRALRWMLEAQKRGYDALILVIDEDDRSERTQELSEAQRHNSISTIPRAFGVAIRTFDAWMLADETALSTVLGRTILRQPDPERIAEPKHTCAQLLAECAESLDHVEMYVAISERIDITLLQSRCSKGFAPFAERVRQL